MHYWAWKWSLMATILTRNSDYTLKSVVTVTTTFKSCGDMSPTSHTKLRLWLEALSIQLDLMTDWQLIVMNDAATTVHSLTMSAAVTMLMKQVLCKWTGGRTDCRRPCIKRTVEAMYNGESSCECSSIQSGQSDLWYRYTCIFNRGQDESDEMAWIPMVISSSENAEDRFNFFSRIL